MLLILKDCKVSVPGAERTIKAVIEKLRKRNVLAESASLEDVEIFIKKGEVTALIAGKNLFDYNQVFFRRVGQKRNMAFMISSIAAKRGIDCIDKIYSSTSAPGKLKQTVSLALKGVPVPDTYFSGEYSDIFLKRASEFLGFPIVIKNSRGQKGRGVFLARNMNELKSIIANNSNGEELFLQKFIPNTFDYRVLVLGETVACAEKRTRIKEGEFRNNIYLGALEEFINLENLDNKVKKTARDAAIAAEIQVAGVDVVVGSDDNVHVFEVNRAPAFTHDENISPELELLTEYLAVCDRKNVKR